MVCSCLAVCQGRPYTTQNMLQTVYHSPVHTQWIGEGQAARGEEMGSTTHMLSPRYSESLTITAPTASRLRDLYLTFTYGHYLSFYEFVCHKPWYSHTSIANNMEVSKLVLDNCTIYCQFANSSMILWQYGSMLYTLLPTAMLEEIAGFIMKVTLMVFFTFIQILYQNTLTLTYRRFIIWVKWINIVNQILLLHNIMSDS